MNTKIKTAIKLCVAYVVNMLSLYTMLMTAVPFVSSGGKEVFGDKISTITVSIVVLALYSYTLMMIYYITATSNKSSKSKEITNHIIENLICGMLRVEVKDRMKILHASSGFKELMGYSSDSDGDGVDYLGDYLCDGDASKICRLAIDCYKTGEHNINTICNVIMQDNYGVKIEGTLKLIGNVEKRAGKLILDCVAIDMSKEVALNNELSTEKERYRLVSEYSDNIILEVTTSGLVAYKSSNFSRILGSIGYNEPILDSFLGRGSVEADDIENIKVAVRNIISEKIQNFEYELQIKETNDEWHWYRLTIMKFSDASRVMCKISKIDREVADRQQLLERVNKDSLTGLMNKEAFSAAVEDRIKAGCEVGTMLFLDIDDFKGLNDSLGHLIGDNALKDLAECIKTNTRECDVASRFGGDEYCIFLDGINLSESRSVIERIRGNAIRQYADGDNKFEVTVSIGAVGYPESGNNVRLLLKKSDQALYKAKRGGKNQACIMQ